MLKLPVILSARKVSAPMLIVLSTITPIVRRLKPLLTTRLHTNRCHSDRNSSGGRALPELPPELPSLERALPSPSVRPLAAVARLLSDLRWLASVEGPDQVGDRVGEWLPMCTTSSGRRRRRASQSRIAGTRQACSCSARAGCSSRKPRGYAVPFRCPRSFAIFPASRRPALPDRTHTHMSRAVACSPDARMADTDNWRMLLVLSSLVVESSTSLWLLLINLGLHSCISLGFWIGNG